MVVKQLYFRNLRPKFGGSIKIFRHIADSKTGNFQRLALGVVCLGKLVANWRNLLAKPGILLSRGRVFWRPETCFAFLVCSNSLLSRAELACYALVIGATGAKCPYVGHPVSQSYSWCANSLTQIIDPQVSELACRYGDWGPALSILGYLPPRGPITSEQLAKSASRSLKNY